jgi:asparagine synthase (glutamine-hydrolysing)
MHVRTTRVYARDDSAGDRRVTAVPTRVCGGKHLSAWDGGAPIHHSPLVMVVRAKQRVCHGKVIPGTELVNPPRSMCGICGIAYSSTDLRSDHELVVAMRDSMSHRGPDGAGIAALPGATLAHRRLSIIDLAHGEQPMTNEDRSVWVTFNGEIYNYLELREELSARGHHFRTRCDTEVLVHAYEEYGDEFVKRLNGMFAFAILDIPRRRTLLARDHLGIKPLFFAPTHGGLAFASEIKGILPALGRRTGPRSESVQEYLMFRYVAWDRTFYDGVSRLPPGHTAAWENGRLTIRRYWAPPVAPKRSTDDLPAASRTLDDLLSRSVKSQLLSDVPLGAFCSGGVDSGLVTQYAARESSGFKTFSVGFDDPAWDETALARDSARRAGAEHHVVIATPRTLDETLQRLIHYHDEPLSHPNSVPLYVLSGLAREHVKVVLTGEGADELFAGYPRYHLARLRAALDFAPKPVRSAAGALLRALPGHRATKAADLLPPSLEDSVMLNSAYVDPRTVAALTGSSVDGALARRRELVAETMARHDAVGSISRYELLTYLPCLLDRMDRMSMAHGLEGRVPFLDVPLVEWALALPPALKLGLRTNKRVVKRLAEGMLSPQIVHGRKSGFGLPLDSWFRGPELAGVIDRIRDPRHPAAAHFDSTVLRGVLARHQSGEENQGELLWLLANVYLWHEAQPARGGSAAVPSFAGAR